MATKAGRHKLAAGLSTILIFRHSVTPIFIWLNPNYIIATIFAELINKRDRQCEISICIFFKQLLVIHLNQVIDNILLIKASILTKYLYHPARHVLCR